MKKTIAILLISLMLFTSGCAVMTAAAPEPTPAPPTVEELLADALKYYNAGNYEEAILLYEAAIEIEPRNFDATVGLGKAYTRKNESDKATTCFRDAMEIKPDSGEPISELAVIYADKGDMDSLNELFSNERARESIEAYTGTAPEAFLAKAAKLINFDVIGWLHIPGIELDQPIMKAGDNYYNLYHDWRTGEEAQGKTVILMQDDWVQGRLCTIMGVNNTEGGVFHLLTHIYEAATGKASCTSNYCGVNLNDAGELREALEKPWTVVLFGKTYGLTLFSVFRSSGDEEKGQAMTMDCLWWNEMNEGHEKDTWEISEWIDGKKSRSDIELGPQPAADAKLVVTYTSVNKAASTKYHDNLYYIAAATEK